MGHMAPSSKLALSLKPSVAVLGESAGAAALMIAWSCAPVRRRRRRLVLAGAARYRGAPSAQVVLTD
jgi:hypothetical protein